MYGLLRSKGLAQLPTPYVISALGNAFLIPIAKGVDTKTSPKSLFLRIKSFLEDGLILGGYS